MKQRIRRAFMRYYGKSELCHHCWHIKGFTPQGMSLVCRYCGGVDSRKARMRRGREDFDATWPYSLIVLVLVIASAVVAGLWLGYTLVTAVWR